jgi:uncharacterized protein
MSQASTDVIIEYNVSARMRDGVELKADIYRPAAPGKYPVLLQRTPYSKALPTLTNLTMDLIRTARAGYVVVIQDVRGRFESGGIFYPYQEEFNDGYDAVEWAAALPHSDGNVGMFGYSYFGVTQWMAAVTQPPHLKAIFPMAAAMDLNFHRGGGVLELSLVVGWTLMLGGPNAVIRAKAGTPEFAGEFKAIIDSIDHIEDVFRTLPLKNIEAMKLGNGFAPYFYDNLEHDTYDDYHLRHSVIDKHGKVKVPALVYSGWYDIMLQCDINHFLSVKAEAAGEAGEKTRLVIGPWTHTVLLDTVGQLNYGMSSSYMLLELKGDLTRVGQAWFDYWLKGVKNNITDEPPVKLFVMGDNIWRGENEWPLARAKYTPLYLHSKGEANSLSGNGQLSFEAPGNEKPDKFTYDPNNPVRTVGGNHLLPGYYSRGPADQRMIEQRQDVLVYTTEVLDRDIEVTGPLKVKLFAASSAPDTDFVARLVDVHPDGSAFNIADGIIRAAYRKGDRVKPSPIKPGETIEYEIDLLATSNVFKKGHRIRVDITSSSFPRWDRNPNTGEASYEAKKLVNAEQTIIHNAGHPSHILLPVIPC